MILLTLIFGCIALWACVRVELLKRDVKRERAVDAEATQMLCEHVCDLTDEVRFLTVDRDHWKQSTLGTHQRLLQAPN